MRAQKLLEFHELKETFGIGYGRRHVRRLERENKFPRRVLLGDKSVAWVESEIVAYVADKINARDKALTVKLPA